MQQRPFGKLGDSSVLTLGGGGIGQVWGPTTRDEAIATVRAACFRVLARELGESPASLAHRYALSLAGVATVVLGVKNRTELRECQEPLLNDGGFEDHLHITFFVGTKRGVLVELLGQI